jgi:hypothetical protein
MNPGVICDEYQNPPITNSNSQFTIATKVNDIKNH